MRIIFIITLIFLINFMQAQDIHYSQFDKTKSLLNPALVSDQDEDYEIQIQRRSQWSSVTIPFNTFSASFNAKKVYKMYSLGVTILNDIAGDSYFATDGLVFSLGKLFKKKENIFSIGLQGAVYQRSINYDGLIFSQNENLQITKFSFFDFGLGISNYKILDQNRALLLGISSYHLNRPKQSFLSDDKVFLSPKYVFHSTYYTSISSKIDISPVIYISLQNQQNEAIIGSGLTYKLNDQVNLKSGIYNRIKDAIFMTLGMGKANFEAIISYDINISTLSNASNFSGGFEFSIVYAWNIIKKTNKIQEKICTKYL